VQAIAVCFMHSYANPDNEERAREIIDSRGNPTVEADVLLDSGHWGRAASSRGIT